MICDIAVKVPPLPPTPSAEEECKIIGSPVVETVGAVAWWQRGDVK